MKPLLLVAIALLAMSCGRARYQGDDAGAGSDGGDSANCGNGTVDTGEECDDGNNVDTDSCTGDCKFAYCGDAIVRAGVEDCDDGDGTDCPDDCRVCDLGNQAVVWSENGHCYSRHDVTLDEIGGSAGCRSLNGHLATYTSAAENDFVTQMLAPTDDYIGYEQGWVTGEDLVYANWGASPSDLCAFQVADGTWFTDGCFGLRGFICETDGWQIRGEDGHAYRVFYEELTYPQARTACGALNMHLATIETEAEQFFLVDLAASTAWIGLDDLDNDGTYTWRGQVDESVEYFNWEGSEPDRGDADENCVTMTPTGSWQDHSCTIEYFPYICEDE